MEYKYWRADIFGQPPNSEPVYVELMQETYALSAVKILDYIDKALIDSDIHNLFSKEQIGIGLNILFCNSCSDFPFCYVENEKKLKNEARKIQAIKNLKFLYTNFFEKYCLNRVSKIDELSVDNKNDYICDMFWDIFVLYPGNATSAMVEAVVEVMRCALCSKNEYCIVSAIHGLGHWVLGADAAKPVLRDWLNSPTTTNAEIIKYANQAQTGCIQ